MIGNAVPPLLACSIVLAVIPELVPLDLEAAA